MPEKLKKAWYKRWWAIVLFIFIGFGIIVSFIPNESDKGVVTTEKSNELITKTPSEMLPIRTEIPTEFTMDNNKEVIINFSGFELGNTLSTSKLEGGVGLISIDYTIYKFSRVEDAKSWYDKRINEIKEIGGYKEIDIPGCFAYKEDFGVQGEDGASICLKNNIVYIIGGNAAQTLKSIDGFMKDAVSLLREKIN
jgi:hypothetical protein